MGERVKEEKHLPLLHIRSVMSSDVKPQPIGSATSRKPTTRGRSHFVLVAPDGLLSRL